MSYEERDIGLKLILCKVTSDRSEELLRIAVRSCPQFTLPLIPDIGPVVNVYTKLPLIMKGACTVTGNVGTCNIDCLGTEPVSFTSLDQLPRIRRPV